MLHLHAEGGREMNALMMLFWLSLGCLMGILFCWHNSNWHAGCRRVLREWDQDVLDGDANPDADFLRRNPTFPGRFLEVDEARQSWHDWVGPYVPPDEVSMRRFSTCMPKAGTP